MSKNEGQPGIWAFIGLDPGVTCGIAWGQVTQLVNSSKWRLHAASTDPDGFLFLLNSLLKTYKEMNVPVLVQAEQFDDRRSPGNQGKQADITREVLQDAINTCKAYGAVVILDKAANVKPFVTDKRLERAGFPLAPKLKDARDAGRHLIYGAVKSGRADDPLR